MNHLKRTVFDTLLMTGETVRIGVVPANELSLPSEVSAPCTLDIGLNQLRPPRDLEVTDSGIRCQLSFSMDWHPVFIPWESVVAILLLDKTCSTIWSMPIESDDDQKPKAKLRSV